MSKDVIAWLAAVIVLLLAEAATAGLTSIWFALGAVGGLITAALHGPVWLQLLWFAVISVVTLLLTRPLAKKFINGRRQPTNADALVGKPCLVTEEINNLAAKGAVSVDGKVWTARSVRGTVIPAGETVIAREIQGVKLIVEEVQE